MADLVKLFVWIPPSLRAAIKVEAAHQRRSMRAVITDALGAYVNDRLREFHEERGARTPFVPVDWSERDAEC